jgi:Zn-dependent protease
MALSLAENPPMLMNLPRTQFDLSWRMFGIPVRVHPTYWLVSVLFALPYLDELRGGGVGVFLIAIGCMFISLMAHELGHALMFRAYHMDSGIFLYSFGGLTTPDGRLPRRSWRNIVTLSGPLANFLLMGLVWGSNYVQPWALTNRYTFFVYIFLFRINLWWGLVNLLPVWPLDGGQISRELWTKYRPYTGVVNSLQMSLIVAIAFSAYAFGCHFNVFPDDWIVFELRPGLFAAILFAILAIENYQELDHLKRAGSYYDDRAPWER